MIGIIHGVIPYLKLQKTIFFGPLDFGFLSKETLRFWGPKKDQDTDEKKKKSYRYLEKKKNRCYFF